MPADFKHVNYSWDDAHAATLDPVARLVYRSNILGDDQRVTNTGGGNTSSKIMEKDPLSGQPTEVLWVNRSRERQIRPRELWSEITGADARFRKLPTRKL